MVFSVSQKKCFPKGAPRHLALLPFFEPGIAGNGLYLLPFKHYYFIDVLFSV